MGFIAHPVTKDSQNNCEPNDLRRLISTIAHTDESRFSHKKAMHFYLVKMNLPHEAYGIEWE